MDSGQWTEESGQWTEESGEWGEDSGDDTFFNRRNPEMSVKDYRDLILWQRATELVVLVYEVTRDFPNDELYGLRSQMRRASVSIPSNIAEGQGRDTTADFLRFLSIANGSRRELETQTIIAQRLDYISEQQSEQILDLATEVGRLRHGLADSLKRKQ